MRSKKALTLLVIAITVAGLAGKASAFYHPTAGRFIQRDPVGYKDGMNLYEFVGGRPTGAVDPWGLDATTVTQTLAKGEASINITHSHSLEMWVLKRDGGGVSIAELPAKSGQQFDHVNRRSGVIEKARVPDLVYFGPYEDFRKAIPAKAKDLGLDDPNQVTGKGSSYITYLYEKDAMIGHKEELLGCWQRAYGVYADDAGPLKMNVIKPKWLPAASCPAHSPKKKVTVRTTEQAAKGLPYVVHRYELDVTIKFQGKQKGNCFYWSQIAQESLYRHNGAKFEAAKGWMTDMKTELGLAPVLRDTPAHMYITDAE